MSKFIEGFPDYSHISDWQNKLITINAPMGSGKSQFIKNELYNYAVKHGQKILFLVHRINCKEQFKIDIKGKEHIITIETYQKIQSQNKSYLKRNYDFEPYDYIVCDEMHYFLTDATFNHTTDLSLFSILEQLKVGKTIIMSSATGNEMMCYLLDELNLDVLDYNLEANYGFIESLTFWKMDNTLETYIQKVISNGEKAIFFIQSATKGFELYNKYNEYAIFNCSKSNKLYKHVEKETIQRMLENKRFEEKILITTSCMDAGVSIIDKDVKNIFVEIGDINTLIVNGKPAVHGTRT